MCQHPANRRLSVRLLKGSFHLIVGMSQQCPPIWMPSKTHFAISRLVKERVEKSAILFINLGYNPHIKPINISTHGAVILEVIEAPSSNIGNFGLIFLLEYPFYQYSS